MEKQKKVKRKPKKLYQLVREIGENTEIIRTALSLSEIRFAFNLYLTLLNHRPDTSVTILNDTWAISLENSIETEYYINCINL